jgi:hypothetical protein
MQDEASTIERDSASQWTDPPTSKQRTSVQKEVTRLIDALAPVRAPVRPGAATPAVQCHRLPRGCVLQGPASAVSISWFAAAPSENSLGELQFATWSGTVSLPGSAVRRSGAQLVAEKVLVPVEGVAGEWRWRGEDVLWTTDDLVAHCNDVLHGPPAA